MSEDLKTTLNVYRGAAGEEVVLPELGRCQAPPWRPLHQLAQRWHQLRRDFVRPLDLRDVREAAVEALE